MKNLIRFACFGAAYLFLLALSPESRADSHTLVINPDRVLRTISPRRLTGTNVALWNDQKVYDSPKIQQLFRDAGIEVCRMPGGSWSDIVFWNGNGVRDASGNIQVKRIKDGYPAIDYSGYAPSLLVKDGHPEQLQPWGGNTDVLHVHEFMKALGLQTLVTVNGGTGRAEDAAQWVRWANKIHDFNVPYWEIGNELDGFWESGHVLPDGSTLTTDKYVRRYAEFARAMKKMDPTIKVGGAASGAEEHGSFAEGILRDDGPLVDFISIHTYPGNPLFSDAQQFARVSVVPEVVGRVRQWIQKYQPARAKQIEIGFSEWNLPGTRVADDIDAALWSALFLRAMAVNGCNFATEWDAFSSGVDSTLIFDPNGQPLPKSEYWAFSMWNHNIGGQIIASGSIEGTDVEYLATRTGDDLCIMFVNTSRFGEVDVQPQITGNTDELSGAVQQLTVGQYFWNPFTHRPDWDTGPATTHFQGTVHVPPFSLAFVHIGLGASSPEAAADSAKPPAEIRLLLPTNVYAGDDAEVWLRTFEQGTDHSAPDADRPMATVSVDTGSSPDSASVRLNESAGRAFFHCPRPGVVHVKASCAGMTTEGDFTVQPSVPRPVIIWQAEEPALDKDHGYESDWSLVKDEHIQPNRPVVRVDLVSTFKTDQHLLLRTTIPDSAKFDRTGIRGVFADVRLAPDFRCSDPNAKIQIVMQSEANWWMVLGEVPLTPDMKADWQHIELKITNKDFIKAMLLAKNVWFTLPSNEPVSGSVYIDKIGLLVR